MGEQALKYVAFCFIFLSAVVLVYIAHKNVSVHIISNIDSTSLCKQTTKSTKKAQIHKCVCKTCFCHLLHGMIRKLEPAINCLKSIICASNLYVVKLQEKSQDLFQYFQSLLNQYSNKTEAPIDEVIKKTKNVQSPKEANNKTQRPTGVTSKVNKVDSRVNKVKRVVDKVDSGVDKYKKTKNVKSPKEANKKAQPPISVTSGLDKVDSGVDKVNSGVDKVDSGVDKYKVDGEPYPKRQTSNRGICKECLERNLMCREGCPGQEETENVQSPKEANNETQPPTGVTSGVDKYKVEGEPYPERLSVKIDPITATSNQGICKECLERNLACLEGCPGQEINN